jgi:hypothetical protein
VFSPEFCQAAGQASSRKAVWLCAARSCANARSCRRPSVSGGVCSRVTPVGPRASRPPKVPSDSKPGEVTIVAEGSRDARYNAHRSAFDLYFGWVSIADEGRRPDWAVLMRRRAGAIAGVACSAYPHARGVSVHTCRPARVGQPEPVPVWLPSAGGIAGSSLRGDSPAAGSPTSVRRARISPMVRSRLPGIGSGTRSGRWVCTW